ncbi:hypothetical protein Dcar01_02596 [Deinococcus carri]|uniref:Amphi-Trp domain-containing protein n=1 Tax=Deinococcus carri TaxID=1211323 RepID=A0ABP9WCP7_9DEIO
MDELEQKLLALHDLLRSLDLPDDTEFTLPLSSGRLTVSKRTSGSVTLASGGGRGVSEHFDVRLSSWQEPPTLPPHVVPEPDSHSAGG